MKSSSSQSTQLADPVADKSRQSVQKKSDRENKETDIAIIGMACRFPGAEDYRQFWQNLVLGVDSVTEIPPERWDWRAYWGDPLTEPNKTNSRWGGFIEDVDKFDASFFNISPREAELMDPQQRILLELSFACIEDAGYRPSALSGSKTGVFIGLCNYDYKELQERYCSQIEGHLLTGTANTIVPNRLSYHFNLHGPSVSVDTACSSSLVALHQAVQSMANGECQMSLVGGINILVSPERYIPFSKLNMLSPTGRCRTFDQQADGYVRGEGAGVILLKRLDRALDDRDQIYGIIKGSAVNHGGQARTLTSPNAFAQSQVIVEAYHRAGVLPTTINYIETHGTGTPLGDPIEIHSLKRAVGKLFKELDQEPQAGYCGLGSVKTNIGHLEAAAGIAGVIKVLLAMKHKKLPGINHFSDLNPRIKLEDSPFYLVEESKNWEAVTNETGKVWPRRAGVSSFGFGGTNAHLIVEEYQGLGGRSQELGEGPQLIVLSAKNEERLRGYVQKLVTFLEPEPDHKTELNIDTLTIEQTLREIVSEIMGVAPSEIEIEQPFEGYGLDPVQWSHLKTMVEERYQCELPITLFSGDASVESVVQYIASLEAEGERKNQVVSQLAPSLTSIAYTLQVGREAMDSRLALVAHNLAEVRHKLTDYLENKTENIYQGGLSANKERLDLLTEGDEAKVFVEMLIKGGKLEKLAQLWVSGVEIEWALLYPNHKPSRISLPTCPFARERYWLPETELSANNRYGMSRTEVLHPLVHKNISDLEEQCFSTVVSGAEFFLTDHQVQGEKVLPGVAYLEMARAAGQLALRDKVVTRIKDVVWVRPMVVKDEPVEAHLGLYPSESGEIGFEISSGQPEGVVHSQGKLVVGDVGSPEPLDIPAIEARCPSTVKGKECYRRLREQGLTYGPALQALDKIRYNEREALAQLDLPSKVADEGYGLHPSLLDGALQAAIGLVISRGDQGYQGAYLPFAVQAVTIYQTVPKRAFAYVQYSDGIEPAGTVVKYDITLTDEQGAICVTLKRLTVRATSEPAKPGIFYSTPDWQVKPLAESDNEPGEEAVTNTLLLLAGLEQGVVEIMAATFKQAEVHSLPEPGSDVAGNVRGLVQNIWPHLQAIVQKKSTKATHRILVVTANTVENHLYAPLVGLLKTVRLEQPHIRGKVITILDPKADSLISLLGREMRPDTFQDVEVGYDAQGIRTVKTLSQIEVNHQEKTTYLKPGGVYWITGGLGALGRVFARHLLDNGEQITVILSGRSPLDEAGLQYLADLSQAGGTVEYLQVDVSQKADVERVVQTIREEYGSINGIIHSAGVIRDSFIINKTEAEIEAVLAPKVSGILNIDAATQAEKLDFMVLFSSIVGVLGNVGQADYAAANAFLNGFAHHRQALVEAGERSGRTLSINWPLWAEGGMSVDKETAAWLKHEIGLTALETSAGLKAFGAGLAQEDITQLLVTSGDGRKLRIYLQRMQRDKVVASDQIVDLTATQKGFLFEATKKYLKALLSETLKLPTARMDPNGPWEKYGIDSIMVLNLTRQLEQSFGELPKTLFFEYQTLTELTSYFVETYPVQLQETLEPTTEKTESAAAPPLATTADIVSNSPRMRWLHQSAAATGRQTANLSENEDIAIVGLSGRYPLAESLVEFWQNLKTGRDCITEIPKERWDYQRFYDADKDKPGKSYSKWGGFIDDVDKFDPLFFNISPREAEMLDPQERLFLETVWQTLEDAGYTRQTLREQWQGRVGVFVGVMWGEYQLYGQEQVSLSSSYASIANRVSYYLNLHGPSLAVDTMCSSSLTSIHLACESIKRGECAAALAGGVNVSIHPNKYLYLSQGSFAASDGRCRSFGEGGDGYVPGEGVGAVLLKSLSQAETDGDQIYGIIKGSSVNHGGKTYGYTVPNPVAQGQLIAETWQKSGVLPESISYVEAHGTGTALGDPIEIRGLSQAVDEGQAGGHACAIGSVKSNIGHLESAAGIAGLTKVLLQMKHQQLAPSIHSGSLNPHIDFAATPFNVQRELTEWKRPLIEVDGVQQEYPRRAGISSFGAGGANAHLVVEEYEPQVSSVKCQVSGPQLIVLSARNEERLRDYAQRILAYLEKAPTSDSTERGADGAKRIPAIQQAVRETTAEIMGVDPAEIEIEQTFAEYGLDPVQLSNLKAMAEEQYCCELPFTLFTEQASVENVAQHMASLEAKGKRKNQGTAQPAPSLVSIAYTLQVGREAMEERLALVVSSVEELVERLRQYNQAGQFEQKQSFIEGLYQANTKTNKLTANLLVQGETGSAFVKAVVDNREFDKLAQLWVSGVDIDWRLLYEQQKPGRISLPTYPFAREWYWIPETELNIISRSGTNTIEVLHPLVHKNTSTLTEQRFSSTFTGTEFFLTDHQVQDEKMLPGIAYLEMARAAGELAVENKKITQLKDVVWVRPLVVKGEPLEVHLGLYPDKNGEIAFEVRSSGVVHSQGKMGVGDVGSAEPLDIPAIEARCLSTVEATEWYRLFREQGLMYGPTFQGVVQLSYNEQEALARLQLPDTVDKELYGLHPSLLDAALQATVGLIISQDVQQSGLYLPFAIQAVNIYATLPEKAWAYVQYSPGIQPTNAVVKYDISLTNEQGQICVALRGFTVRAIAKPPQDNILYSTPDWQVKALVEDDNETSEAQAANTLLLIGLEEGVVETVDATFDQAEVVVLPKPGSDANATVTSLVQKGWAKLKGIVENKPDAGHQIVVVAADTVDVHLYTPLVGLLKTGRLEHPHIRGKVIAVSNPKADSLMSLLRRELRMDSFREVEVRYDASGTRAVKTLSQIALTAQEKRAYLKPGGVYWITGGLGGLGRIFARHLLDQGEDITVILSGRSELDESGQKYLTELNGLANGTAAYLSVDVSVKAKVEQAVQRITEQYGSLKGIIHSAGVIRDSFIVNKTDAEMTEVLAPKVTGILNIDAATQAETLDFMVLFSSIAGELGNVGQVDYAAANAFLDGFAHHRQTMVEAGERSGRTLSINWPLWAEGGMSVDEETVVWLQHEVGLSALETAAGLEAFDAGLGQGDINQLLITSGDGQKIWAYLEGIIERDRTVASGQSAELNVAEKDRLFQTANTYLKAILSETLKLPTSRVESNASWEKYGLDSIRMLNLTRQLEQRFGELPKTLFFEYQTLTELTGYFVETYPVQLQKTLEPTTDNAGSGAGSALTTTADTVSNSPRTRWLHRSTTATDRQTKDLSENKDIAIVGLSGRYPLAQNLTEFWQNLKTGRDCITEIPKARWDYRRFYDADKDKPGKSYSKWGGFIDDVDKFDPLFFNISPREAEMIDPQERLFLETVWQTLEDAGYTRQTLHEQLQGQVGVFVGVMWGEYQLYGQDQVSLSSSYASIANRVSYYLNLYGPSLAVDTMCSSSLTSIHLACESIKRGECTVALAGGVNVSIHPNKYLQLSQGNFAASDGRCRSFGEGGDGYVPGEGVGAVLLKPLPQAEADGDQIYGIIKGSSVNHGGKTHGYTVPNPNAQRDLIAKALAESGIEAGTISYVEAHGTGTALGDPIEIKGLTNAFGNGQQRSPACAIGSVKSNIGHLEAAAGIAGLTKVLLQMKHQQLVPSLHSENLNPHIDFKNSPFKVQRELAEWKRPIITIDGVQREYPRRAGISSFGAGGANAHLVVEEYQGVPEAEEQRSATSFTGAGEMFANSVSRKRSDAPQPPRSLAQLIVLSAKNKERLREYAQKMLKFLEEKSALKSTDQELVKAEHTLTIEQTVRAMAAEIMGVEADDLEEYGLDPVQLSRLKTMAEERYRCELPSPFVSEAASVGSVAQYIASLVTEEAYENQVASQPALSLASIAYTLQVGREAMEARLAFTGDNLAEVRNKLSRYLENKTENIYQGHLKANKELLDLLTEGDEAKVFVEMLINAGKLEKLAQLWVAGVEIDWSQLHGEETPKRISLPTYPFAGERYWISETEDYCGKDAAKIEYKPTEPLTYHPHWVKAPLLNPRHENRRKLSGACLIIYRDEGFGFEKALGAIEENVHYLRLGTKNEKLEDTVWMVDVNDPTALQGVLKTWPEPERIYFLGGLHNHTGNKDFLAPEVVKQQEIYGLLTLFRVIDVLKQNNVFSKQIDFFIFTQNTYPILNRVTNPLSSDLTGLAYGLAQTWTNLSVRQIDLSREDLLIADTHPKLVQQIVQEPTHPRGAPIILYQGTRFARQFVQYHIEPHQESVLKENGVYLILGGAGTVGYAVSRELVKRFQVQVIWLGRRALDRTIQEKIEQIGAWGKAPVYIQTDAADRIRLQESVSQIKRKWPKINGVIHSGMNFSWVPLHEMSESDLMQALNVKKSGSINLFHVFSEDTLDFICFFSSAQAFSFLEANNSSHYAAGTTFKDAFAHSIRRLSSHPVITLNWGYWRSAFDAEFLPILEANGIGVLDDEEGFEIFEQALLCQTDQLLGVKLNEQFVQETGGSKTLKLLPVTQPSYFRDVVSTLPQRETQLHLAQEQTSITPTLERFAVQGVIEGLTRLGWQQYLSQPRALTTLRQNLQIMDKYDRLFQELIAILSRHQIVSQAEGIITLDHAKIETGKDVDLMQKGEVLVSEFPDSKAPVRLLTACLTALPEVLTGKINAPEILFPDASMVLVEGIFRDNPAANYFNDRVADVVAGFVTLRHKALAGEKIRILEIGAGTGGTSRALFKQLEAYSASLEYYYTDLSKSFLNHAEQQFQKEAPYLKFEVFDVEKPLAEQGIAEGEFDLVIAANVLHATRNISHTLEQTKALLKKHGLLVINEVTARQVFATLTFGLLDGWWLYEDEEIRLKNCPALPAENWEQLLQDQGFFRIHLVDKGVHQLSQQIIVAESDGIIRQSIRQDVAHPKLIKSNAVVNKLSDFLLETESRTIGETIQNRNQERIKPALVAFAADPTRTGEDNIRDYLGRVLSQIARIPVAKIDPDKSFYDYGVDSIMGMQLRRQIEASLEIGITGRELLEHSTIQSLARLLDQKIDNPAREQITGSGSRETDIVTKTQAEEALEKFKCGEMSLEEIKALL